MLSLLHRTPAPVLSTTCECRHQHEAHEHYRPGDDCGFATCGCTHFQAHEVTAHELAVLTGLHAA